MSSFFKYLPTPTGGSKTPAKGGSKTPTGGSKTPAKGGSKGNTKCGTKGNTKRDIAPKANSFINAIAPVVNKRKVKKPPINRDSMAKEILDSIDVETCNIVYIDEQILKKLRSKISTIPEMEQDLSSLLWIINNSPDAIDKMQAKTETAILRRKIQDIEGGFDLALYIMRSADILSEYKKLTQETRSNSFVKVSSTRDEGKIHRKQQLVLEYLRIAKDYVNLENFKQTAQKTTCGVCYSSNLEAGDDDSILVCKGCGMVVELLDDTPSFKDSERVNMSSRYTYTCRGHFVEALNRFEGKQNTEIDPVVIDVLEKELALHGLDATTATKDHIYMFLSEKKLSDSYCDINLLYYLITKVNPPDITEYRNELLEMHDQLEEAYSSVKDNERLNSLNVNWKLYKLLQLLDYSCKKDDFFCLKTPTKQGEHEQKWYDMIDYLQNKYPNAVTSYGKKRWRHTRTI